MLIPSALYYIKGRHNVILNAPTAAAVYATPVIRFLTVLDVAAHLVYLLLLPHVRRQSLSL